MSDQSPGLTEALRALQLDRGRADDADRPVRVSTLPGSAAKPLPGQLALGQESAEQSERRGEAA